MSLAGAGVVSVGWGASRSTLSVRARSLASFMAARLDLVAVNLASLDKGGGCPRGVSKGVGKG